MNIYTFKLTKKMLAAIILAVAAVIALLIILIPSGKDVDAWGVRGMSGRDDLVKYISSLGYEVDDNVWESRDVIIPSSFDDTYTKYNDLQKECGFDLSKYKGKTATLHTFGIKNYRGDGVLCDLLVYKKAVIGGAVYTADVNGFMHGLKKAEK